jgi:Protein of unknown function (DUF1097)
MSETNAAAVSGGILAAIMIMAMLKIGVLPIWPLVIAWGIFFHIGGGGDPNKALAKAVTHAWFGVACGWVSAFLVLVGPPAEIINPLLWAGIVVGLTLLTIGLAAHVAWFSITPVCVYGFAMNWGFLLNVPAHFTVSSMLSFSLANSLIAVPISILIGVCFGWAQAWLARKLATRARIATQSV